MKIDVLTLFPEMFKSLNHSILGRAIEKKVIEVNIINIRDFSKDVHKKVDDTPFGGGAGMLMTCQPLCDAILSVKKENSHIIFLTPCKNVLTQQQSKKLAKFEHLILICGHYEGIDERIINLFVNETLSIGNYVLTGGELPAMVVIDCISRHIKGVLGSEESAVDESFSIENEIEYPQYTRPREFMGLKVPDVLVNGNHAEIEKWKKENKR